MQILLLCPYDTYIMSCHFQKRKKGKELIFELQTCRVPSSMWSKIGRLKRSVMPRLVKRSNMFGSGASPGIMSCIAGRLLCDTYLCSRDLLKEV